MPDETTSLLPTTSTSTTTQNTPNEMPQLNPGKQLFRTALLFEAIINSITGISIMTFPYSILNTISTKGSSINPLSTSLIQLIGSFILLLSTPLIFSYPNTVYGISSRPNTYSTLASGEIFLIGILGYQYYMDGIRSGLNQSTYFSILGVLCVTLIARIWVLCYWKKIMGFVNIEKQD